VLKSDEEHNTRWMKRIKKNCPLALSHMGKKHNEGGDFETALKYLTKAAELGDPEAHFVLSVTYRKGRCVEKDAEKEVYHLEQAAIGGHHLARYNLGIEEWDNGRFERAKKHFIINANLGDDGSLKSLRKLYADGHASKEDYAGALRAYQTAVEATKSSQREGAEAYYEALRAVRQS